MQQSGLLCINKVTHFKKVNLSWKRSREVDPGNWEFNLQEKKKGLLKLLKQRLDEDIIVVRKHKGKTDYRILFRYRFSVEEKCVNWWWINKRREFWHAQARKEMSSVGIGGHTVESFKMQLWHLGKLILPLNFKASSSEMFWISGVCLWYHLL